VSRWKAARGCSRCSRWRKACCTKRGGVAIYTRIEPETILVLHLAVKKDYSFPGSRADGMLFLRFVAELSEIASRFKDVRNIPVGSRWAGP